ncbi:MAG: hypothetical protein IKZ96_03310 [Bacilli bacterium]|nr:hypothetical protein [Bacilli bacterium]
MSAIHGKKYASLSEQLIESGGCKDYYGNFKTIEEAQEAFSKMLLPNGRIYEALQELQAAVGSLKRYKVDAYPAQNLDGGYCIILSVVELLHKPEMNTERERVSLSEEEKEAISRNARRFLAEYDEQLKRIGDEINSVTGLSDNLATVYDFELNNGNPGLKKGGK